MVDKKIDSFMTGVFIGHSIYKAIEIIIGLFIMVLLWIIPLYLIDLLPLP